MENVENVENQIEAMLCRRAAFQTRPALEIILGERVSLPEVREVREVRGKLISKNVCLQYRPISAPCEPVCSDAGIILF